MKKQVLTSHDRCDYIKRMKKRVIISAASGLLVAAGAVAFVSYPAAPHKVTAVNSSVIAPSPGGTATSVTPDPQPAPQPSTTVSAPAPTTTTPTTTDTPITTTVTSAPAPAPTPPPVTVVKIERISDECINYATVDVYRTTYSDGTTADKTLTFPSSCVNVGN